MGPTLQSPGDENFPERKFQRAAKGPLRSLASEQPMCVRKPPKAEEEPPERTGKNNPWSSHRLGRRIISTNQNGKCHDSWETRTRVQRVLPQSLVRCCICSITSNSLLAFGLQPAGLLCSWGFPGKNTGVGCHFLLQAIFLILGSNLCLLGLHHWQADSLPLSHQEAQWVRSTLDERLPCVSSSKHSP